jgi:hypothetical protein
LTLFTTMTAVCDMFKALAYLAAEYVAAGKDWAAPQPVPEGWDRYLTNLWPDIGKVLSRVPAADEGVGDVGLGGADNSTGSDPMPA